jgi:hypothetical protein
LCLVRRIRRTGTGRKLCLQRVVGGRIETEFAEFQAGEQTAEQSDGAGGKEAFTKSA